MRGITVIYLSGAGTTARPAEAQGRDRLGTQLGLASHAADEVLRPSDPAMARHLGRRLAGLAARVAAGGPAASC